MDQGVEPRAAAAAHCSLAWLSGQGLLWGQRGANWRATLPTASHTHARNAGRAELSGWGPYGSPLPCQWASRVLLLHKRFRKQMAEVCWRCSGCPWAFMKTSVGGGRCSGKGGAASRLQGRSGGGSAWDQTFSALINIK